MQWLLLLLLLQLLLLDLVFGAAPRAENVPRVASSGSSCSSTFEKLPCACLHAARCLRGKVKWWAWLGPSIRVCEWQCQADSSKQIRPIGGEVLILGFETSIARTARALCAGAVENSVRIVERRACASFGQRSSLREYGKCKRPRH